MNSHKQFDQLDSDLSEMPRARLSEKQKHEMQQTIRNYQSERKYKRRFKQLAIGMASAVTLALFLIMIGLNFFNTDQQSVDKVNTPNRNQQTEKKIPEIFNQIKSKFQAVSIPVLVPTYFSDLDKPYRLTDFNTKEKSYQFTVFVGNETDNPIVETGAISNAQRLFEMSASEKPFSLYPTEEQIFKGNATLISENELTLKTFKDGMGVKWSKGDWSYSVIGHGPNDGVQLAKVIIHSLNGEEPIPKIKQGKFRELALGKSLVTMSWTYDEDVWYTLNFNGNNIEESIKTARSMMVLQALENKKNKEEKVTDVQELPNQLRNTSALSDIKGILHLKENVAYQLKYLDGGAGSFGYEIDKTLDGGNTWNKQSEKVLNQVNSIYFKDENNGFIVNNSYAYETTPGLFITKNGGVDWTYHPQLPIPSQYKEEYYRQGNYPVFFTDKIGVLPIYGYKGEESIKFLYMLVTQDGGATWNAVTGNKMGDLSWQDEKTEDRALLIYFNKTKIKLNY